MKTLQDEFRKQMENIAHLSIQANENNTQKILEMMNNHINEITTLYQENDQHWAIETADLIVLCYELLLDEHQDIDEVCTRCLPRFEKKLQQLVVQKKRK